MNNKINLGAHIVDHSTGERICLADIIRENQERAAQAPYDNYYVDKSELNEVYEQYVASTGGER